jgi:hypothetical protein
VGIALLEGYKNPKPKASPNPSKGKPLPKPPQEGGLKKASISFGEKGENVLDLFEGFLFANPKVPLWGIRGLIINMHRPKPHPSGEVWTGLSIFLLWN